MKEELVTTKQVQELNEELDRLSQEHIPVFAQLLIDQEVAANPAATHAGWYNLIAGKWVFDQAGFDLWAEARVKRLDEEPEGKLG